MQTNNKSICQFSGEMKDLVAGYTRKLIWLIVLSMSLTNIAFAFSVGAVNGLNCIGPKSCIVASVLAEYETVHQNITSDGLVPSDVNFVPPGSLALISFGPTQIMQIQDGNKSVDMDQTHHEKHFDNELFTEGLSRLASLQADILFKLMQPTTLNKIEAADLRAEFGAYLHTLQDFFAHSTWVNNNTNVPPLWENPVALPSNNYTLSCLPYPLTGTLAHSDAFTSGYAGSTAYLQSGLAPIGKCAHGLVTLDNPFLSHAENGIHKDWYGRPLHKQARTQAQYATSEAARTILSDKKNIPDNVCMFMTDKPCVKANPFVGTWIAPDNSEIIITGDGSYTPSIYLANNQTTNFTYYPTYISNSQNHEIFVLTDSADPKISFLNSNQSKIHIATTYYLIEDTYWGILPHYVTFNSDSVLNIVNPNLMNVSLNTSSDCLSLDPYAILTQITPRLSFSWFVNYRTDPGTFTLTNNPTIRPECNLSRPIQLHRKP